MKFQLMWKKVLSQNLSEAITLPELSVGKQLEDAQQENYYSLCVHTAIFMFFLAESIIETVSYIILLIDIAISLTIPQLFIR